MQSWSFASDPGEGRILRRTAKKFEKSSEKFGELVIKVYLCGRFKR
jgi:hypothetical protein